MTTCLCVPRTDHSPWAPRARAECSETPVGPVHRSEMLTREAGEEPAELGEPVAVEPLLGVLHGGRGEQVLRAERTGFEGALTHPCGSRQPAPHHTHLHRCPQAGPPLGGSGSCCCKGRGEVVSSQDAPCWPALPIPRLWGSLETKRGLEKNTRRSPAPSLEILNKASGVDRVLMSYTPPSLL